MAFEHWHCERCHSENTVQYKKDAGVWEVKERISAQHRKRAFACHEDNGIIWIRIGKTWVGPKL